MLSALYLISTFTLVVRSSELLSLDGSNWTAFNSNRSIIVDARVPGSIYTDLLRGKILQEDPYYRYNDGHYRWVALDRWTFTKTFTVSQRLLNNTGVYLVCHGIDTVSRIFINGKLVGFTDNMFVRYKFDAKSLLRVGSNRLVVAVRSAINYSQKKSDEHERVKGYRVPPECTVPVQKGECHVNFIRKMQASFSWDWGPAFPTQGIWKHIAFEAYQQAIIRDVLVETIFNDNSWFLKVKIILESTSDKTFEGSLHLFLNQHLLFNQQMQFIPDSEGIVETKLKLPVTVPITKWWPNGVGSNVQKLYQLKVVFADDRFKEESIKMLKIGFRTIELVQNRVFPRGLTFYFKVNGLPFFAKGSNWIPAHSFYELVDRKYIQRLLGSAFEANMNMLRVWGGGVYELDEFYETADELGILIWQDLMFACALYPADDKFLESVAVEVRQNIRRLQHHPSVALWAGNNENELAILSWWGEVFYHRNKYENDYRLLYVNVSRSIILDEDASRSYVASSPSNGLESEKSNWISYFPSDPLFGDVHVYNYAPNSWDWTKYPSARFASEYGFQSYPSLKTLKSYSKPSDWTYPISKLFNYRQRHLFGNQEIELMIAYYMWLPPTGGKQRFEDLIYLSQITQAMAIRAETEVYRRNRRIDTATGLGFTMGALIWQLNDIWPGQSWSSLEFGGKWKMVHYYAKRIFANLLVSVYESGDMLMVSVVSDDYEMQKHLLLSVKVFKWSSTKPVWQQKSKALTGISPNAHSVFQANIRSLLDASGCPSRNDCLVVVDVDDGLQTANNFLLLGPLNTARGLVNPRLQVIGVKRLNTSDAEEPMFAIELRASSVAAFVWLDFATDSPIAGVFSDNGFIMTDEKRVIFFRAEIPIPDDRMISDNLTVKSLAHVPKNI